MSDELRKTWQAIENEGIRSDLDAKESLLRESIGKFNRYQNLIAERHGAAATPQERLAIAQEVLDGPWLGVLGAQAEKAKLDAREKNDQLEER